MRRTVVVPRTSMKPRSAVKPRSAIKAAAVALVAGLAACACSSTQLGAAAVTSRERITVSSLTSQVAKLNSAYAVDKKKGLKPQRPVGQETQQVLTWLILFQVYDEIAAQHHISVSQSDLQAALGQFQAQAKQSNVTLDEFYSAGGALPPSLLPDLERAGAIQTALLTELNGGTAPTSASQQQAVQQKLPRQECLAAKNLDINVNPQYGVYDYSGFSVVASPSTLAADPTPSPSASAVRRNPPC
jgi:hypothetical protein